jgi:SAM-dependent methyltransferase
MKCCGCSNKYFTNFLDLGKSPIANNYKKSENEKEEKHLLKIKVCKKCWLVQNQVILPSKKLFKKDYSYFSSYSTSWLKHAEDLVNSLILKFKLQKTCEVGELASNDGYLLQFFKKKGYKTLGFEPTYNSAMAAKKKGLKVVNKFFSKKLAGQFKKRFDVVLGLNVIAHVPNINDFLSGIRIIMKDNGVAVLEFAYLDSLVKNNQFDTIYHEHYFYYSLIAIKNLVIKNSLKIFDVVKLKSHGGSLRIFLQHKNGKLRIKKSVQNLIDKELYKKINDTIYYETFQNKVEKIKLKTIKKLNYIKKTKKKLIAYGAAAKGVTLLNYINIDDSFCKFVVDKNPNKIGKYIPGTKIKIVSPKKIINLKPDYIWILPWNLKKEISKELSYVKKWNCKFLTTIPKIQINK